MQHQTRLAYRTGWQLGMIEHHTVLIVTGSIGELEGFVNWVLLRGFQRSIYLGSAFRIADDARLGEGAAFYSGLGLS